MVPAAQTTTIEVDVQTAEILRRARESAEAQGQTLEAYLRHHLNADNAVQSLATQREAWMGFVMGMTSWSKANLPAGHRVDDGRETMYDDRD
jgi:hypothetical protein